MGHKMGVVSDYLKIWNGLWYVLVTIKFKDGRVLVLGLQGLARTQLPTNRNCDPKVVTLELLAGVSLTEVQWKGLFLGEPPSWSRLTPGPGKYEVVPKLCNTSILSKYAVTDQIPVWLFCRVYCSSLELSMLGSTMRNHLFLVRGPHGLKYKL